MSEQSSQPDNNLRIETGGLTVELSGAPDEIAEAYEALRPLLRENYGETLRGTHSGEKQADETASSSSNTPTQPLHREKMEEQKQQTQEPSEEMSAAVRAVAPDSSETPSTFIQLVLRRGKYTKVHVLERAELTDSFLGRALDASVIHRLYTDAKTEKRLRSTLEVGDTLWRELTPAGRAEVERRSRDPSGKSSDE